VNFKLKHLLERAPAIAVAVALTVASAVEVNAQAVQPPAATKSFLWKVQSGPRVLYLAGSVHALSADVYPLAPAFEQAFAAADTLLEEINLEQSGLLALGPMLLSKAMYQDGRTFHSVVSKETADLVATHLKGTPMASELIRPMKPWMVMLLLSAMQVQQAGLNPELGLDKYFFDKAAAAGKSVIGLETAESQIDRFDMMPETLQEQLLRSALDELDVNRKELATVVAAWRRGDAAAIERGVLGGFKKYPAAYQSLIVERNQNWMPQLEKCLARTTPCMVVVGAGHVVGPDGLLTLLRKKGYRVEQQ
jgi:uncharacterized protein YbaP (TraB family)